MKVRLGSNPLMDFLRTTAKDVASDKEVKTQALVLAINQITGSDPIIDKSNPNKNIIRFTKKQQDAISRYFESKPGSSKEGTTTSNVEIDHKPLWMPFVIKKASPYIFGLFVIGVMVGRLTK